MRRGWSRKDNFALFYISISTERRRRLWRQNKKRMKSRQKMGGASSLRKRREKYKREDTQK
jgi:hypothetical protein